MMDVLQGIGYGIVALTILVVVGSVVIYKLGDATGGTANTTATYLLGQLGSSGLSGLTIPAHYGRNFIEQTPEYRLKSGSGQDRSVKHENYARTTDKGCFTFHFDWEESIIYSLNSNNNIIRN